MNLVLIFDIIAQVGFEVAVIAFLVLSAVGTVALLVYAARDSMSNNTTHKEQR
tara:strand:+ start:337 stop:495 length:159 start_codon:yes stop_codon:yes gene_type:complete